MRLTNHGPALAPRRPRALRRVVAVLVALPLLLLGARAVSLAVASGPGATGAFVVRDGVVYDPSGRKFVPAGVNLGGPHSWIGQATKGVAPAIAAWGFNTVRLVMCAEPTCDMYGNGWTGQPDNGDLESIVQELTARHIVVMLELHNVAPGELPSPEQVTRIGSWWADTARTYASNPYVWFNLLNEPGAAMPAPSAWLDVHDRMLSGIRAAGASNIVVVDGSQWGQDAQWGGAADVGPVQTSASAILTYGPTLQKKYSNLLFSIHPYGLWGAPGTDQQRIDRFTDFYTRVRAFGGALVIGEVGSSSPNDASGLAARAVYGFAATQPVGVISWTPPGAFDMVTPAGSFDQIDDTVNPTNLNWLGRLAWDHAHGLAAAGNPVPNARPSGAPALAAGFDTDAPGWAALAGGSAVRSNRALQVVGGSEATVRWSIANGTLTPGTSYSLRARVRAVARNERLKITFRAFDDSGHPMATSVATAWARSGWGDVDATLTTPVGHWSTAFVDISMPEPGGFAIDDAQLAPLDGSSPPPATTTAPASPPPTVPPTRPTAATTVAPATTVGVPAVSSSSSSAAPSSSSSSSAAVPPTTVRPTTVAPGTTTTVPAPCAGAPVAREGFDTGVLPPTVWSDDRTTQLDVVGGHLTATGSPTGLTWLPQVSIHPATAYRVCAGLTPSSALEPMTATVRQWDERWNLVDQLTVPITTGVGTFGHDIVTAPGVTHFAMAFSVLHGSLTVDDLTVIGPA